MKTKKVKKIESKHIYEKIYEYKNMDAMKRFFLFETERAENSFKVYNIIKEDFSKLNFMKILDYEKIEFSPMSIKTKLITEDIDKTYHGHYEHFFDYLAKSGDKEKILYAINRWSEVEKNFINKGYYYLDFHLGNIMIDKNKSDKRYVIIDFDEMIKDPLFFRKKLFTRKSVRSFEVSIKLLLMQTNFSYKDKVEILQKIKDIKSFYNVKSRQEDLEQTKMILKNRSFEDMF